MNHFAHSEATKMAKSVEVTLKGKLDDMELSVTKLEAELKQYVSILLFRSSPDPSYRQVNGCHSNA